MKGEKRSVGGRILATVTAASIFVTAASTVFAKPPEVQMTNGQGKPLTLKLKNLPKSRNYQYCELVFDYGDKGNDIYSTSPLAECDLDWWEGLDLSKLANDLGAKAAYKNGPQWWSMDKVSLMLSEPVKIAGVSMVFGANLPPGTMAIPKYTIFSPAKFQKMTWVAGEPIYQIVDAEGYVYVLQGNKIPVEKLAKLGDKFQSLPSGWKYRVTKMKKDLIMNLTPAKAIPSFQDEFQQVYIRITE